MQLNYHAYLNNTGYSCAAQDYILAMMRVKPNLDIRVHYVNTRLGIGISDNRKQLFTALHKKAPKSPSINLYHTIPNRYHRPPEKQKHVGFCVYETIDPPKRWISLMNNMDLIITASHFNKNVFESSGVKTPVCVVPHCFDPKLFNENICSRGRYSQKTFISIGTWKNRKNWRTLIKGWYEAFEARNNVCLLIKTDKIQNLRKEVEYIKRTGKWRTKNTAPIYCEEKSVHDFEEIPRIMKKGDIYICCSLGEGFGLCFYPQTEIITNKGVKPISKIKEGDYIWDSRGYLTSVLETTSRTIDENIIHIEVQGSELMVTGDHKILTCDYRYKNKKKLCGFSWKSAKTINKKDYLFLPKIKLRKTIRNIIDVTDLIECEFDDEYVWQKSGYSPHQNQKYSISSLTKELNCSKKQIENARKFTGEEISSCSKKVRKIIEYISRMDIPIPEPRKYPRFIKIDKHFMNLSGWYIAEGSGDNKRMELSMGSQDDPYIPQLIKYLKKLNCKPRLIKLEKKRRIICTGTICGIFPKLFGSDSHNKKIPDQMFTGRKEILPLLRAYILGDGCLKDTRRYRTRFTTTSNELVNQIWLIFNSLGIWSSYKKDKRGAYSLEVLGKFSQKLRNLLNFPLQNFNRTPCNRVFDIESGFVIPVKSVTSKKYKGKVYDISVLSDDHAFIANKIVAHNSGLHAMALGIPVITTRFGGSLEYAKSDLCTYLEPDRYHTIPVMDSIPQLANSIWPFLSIKELATKMQYVLNKPKEIDKQAKRAYKYVHKNFTYETIGRKFLECLEMI